MCGVVVGLHARLAEKTCRGLNRFRRCGGELRRSCDHHAARQGTRKKTRKEPDREFVFLGHLSAGYQEVSAASTLRQLTVWGMVADPGDGADPGGQPQDHF